MASGGYITSNFGERFSTWGKTMKFMLLMYNNETLWNRMTKAEQDAAVDRLMKFNEQLSAADKLILTQGLAPGIRSRVDSSRTGRRAGRHRWAVRRDQGGSRRLSHN